MRPRRLRAAERGYILLFTLGALTLAAVLLAGVGPAVRLDAQAVAADRERLASEYALRACVQRAMAQITATPVLKQLQAAQPGVVNPQDLWEPGPTLRSFDAAGRRVEASIVDAGGIPDGNLLTRDEWIRLLTASRWTSAETAPAHADAVLQRRARVLVVTGMGFVDFDETGLAREWIEGDPDDVDRPPLRDLVTWGTGLKQIEWNQTPLLMFHVLGGATPSQIGRIDALRRSASAPTPDQIRQALAGVGGNLQTGASRAVRIRCRLLPQGDAAATGDNIRLTADLLGYPGPLQLLSQRFDFVAPVRER